jgi:hypothetical protein
MGLVAPVLLLLLLLAGLLLAIGAYVALMVLLSHGPRRRRIGGMRVIHSRPGDSVHLRIIRPAHALIGPERIRPVPAPERRR